MPSQLLSIPEKPLNQPVTECRIYERQACELPTTCQPASALEMKEMRWTATIADISLGGVRIHLLRRFEKGTCLAIELPGSTDRDSTVVFVKVVYVKTQGNGAWALGCKFISELSEDQLQSLLTSTDHVLSSQKQELLEEEKDDAHDETEAETPTTVNAEGPEAKFLSNVHLEVETRRGSPIKCKIKRLNVTKCWPLIPGKVLSLQGKTADQAPWTLRIQITQCHPYETGWEIQGRLVRPAANTDALRAVR